MKNRSDFESAIVAHALRDAPLEACGAVVRHNAERVEAVPIKNVAPDPANFFRLEAAPYLELFQSGKIVAIYHSHAAGKNGFSEADRVGAEETKIPAYLYEVETDTITAYTPTGYRAPILGRTYLPGVNDCYSLVRDYLAENGITSVPLIPRNSEDMVAGLSNMRDLWLEAGFHRVAEATKPLDVILMTMRSSTGRPNHMAVMTKDHTMLHQLLGKPSRWTFQRFLGRGMRNSFCATRAKGKPLAAVTTPRIPQRPRPGARGAGTGHQYPCSQSSPYTERSARPWAARRGNYASRAPRRPSGPSRPTRGSSTGT